MRYCWIFLFTCVFAGACAHRPASFNIYIPQGENHLVLEQELYQNWGQVRMGHQGRGQPGRKSYTFSFNMNDLEGIRYAYLSIDCLGVDRPKNPISLNGHPIGFLQRGGYGTTFGVGYAGDQGPREKLVQARTQRYLPGSYFRSGKNTLQFGQQKLYSSKTDGQVSLENYTIKNINLAVYKVRTVVGSPKKAYIKSGERRFPEQFKFFSLLSDEELYIVLIKLPYLLAELSDSDSDYAKNIGFVYSKIGDYYRWTGFYKKSLDYQLKANEIQLKQPLSFLTARIRIQLALAYYAVGDYDSAVIQCEKSLEDIKKIRDREPYLGNSEKGNTADYLESLSYAYLALNYYHRADRSNTTYYARRVINAFKDDWGYFGKRQTRIGWFVPVALAHQALGDYDLRDGRFAEALKRYLTAESFLGYEVRPEIYHDQMSTIKLSIAMALYHLGQYQEAYQTLETIEDPTTAVMWRSYLLRGMIFQSKKDLGKAAEKYLEAITEIEFARNRLTSHGLKVNFMTDKQEPYSRMVQCLVKLNRQNEAFDFAEKAKARAFLDLIAETDKVIGRKNEILTELTLEEKRLRKVLIDIQHQTDMNRRMFNERGDNGDLSQQLRNARGALGAFLSRWFGKNKDFASLRSAKTLSISDIQRLIPTNMALIEYFYDADRLYAWVISRNHARFVEKPIAAGELTSLVKTYRSLIVQPERVRGLSIVREPTAKSASQKTFIDANNRLYAVLVEGVMRGLSAEKIYIVPHGTLHYMPFQALFNRERYLIERYQIGYLPSASVLKHVIDARRPRPDMMLAFGNPDLGNSQMDLPFAEKEVQDIGQLFPRAKVLTRQDATESAFKKSAPDFAIIHIASHGDYDPEAPLLSCLRLGAGEGEDGRLETQEIFDLDLDAYLVALSACNTALGKVTKGDELMGLTRAFIFAGTPSILGTFWSVNDESTREAMERFYANLVKMDKFQAMQQAQLSMIQDRRFQHPYYWAGFQIIGDYQ
ncbi:MAG: CHAT domain-containing tetratricopeptide repeat protein [Desulfobacteraceae bacterium]|jgi:tetratricopeptide (TPR) repeat protein|nr:CHAT domain-containing tetratricopeptide repeat protein [Desulfobacteraceae bacterium]